MSLLPKIVFTEQINREQYVCHKPVGISLLNGNVAVKTKCEQLLHNGFVTINFPKEGLKCGICFG